MSSIPIFDLLLSRERQAQLDHGSATGVPRAARLAADLVVDLLAEFRHVRSLDDEVGAIRSPDGPFDREFAVLLEAAYADWAHRAGSVLRRVDRIERRGNPVPRSDELREGYGRTMAMLQVTLDDLDVAEDQVRRGDVVPVEELRRELRARVQ